MRPRPVRWSVPRAALLVALVTVVAACGAPARNSRSAARAFLDRHYVAIDLDAARGLTVSLAASKIADEIELTRGFVIDAGVAKPRINYSLARSDEAELKARYVYELTIRPPGLEPFAKLVTLSLRSTADGWRVTNYSESDP